jgi:hypothetical protein
MSLGGLEFRNSDEFGRVYGLGFWTMLGVYDEFGRFRV